MSNDELLTQSEANNLLLHQKTELRLQEVDKVLTSMNKSIENMVRTQEQLHKDISHSRDNLKKEIEKEFITKEDFTIFALKTEQHWKKFNWMLAGAVAVLLGGSWLISQYSMVSQLAQTKDKYVTTDTLKEVVKEAIKEAK